MACACTQGMEEHNNYAVDFFNATKVIKETCPYAKISYLRLPLPTHRRLPGFQNRTRAGLAATAAAHRAALRRAANTSIHHAACCTAAHACRR